MKTTKKGYMNQQIIPEIPSTPRCDPFRVEFIPDDDYAINM